jgi:hypothetical protein
LFRSDASGRQHLSTATANSGKTADDARVRRITYVG